jgi:hypothetical protein
MTPIETPAHEARIHVIAEGVLASYIHELATATQTAVAAVPAPAQSPNCGMEAA